MAWVGDAAFTLGMALVARLTANCPESPETVQRDLRELGPDAMLAPPRIWENMLTADADQGQRRLAAEAPRVRVFPRAGRALRAEAQRRQVLVARRPRSAWRWARSSSTARCATSSACARRAGATPAARRWGPTPIRFFRSFGINLKQVYGATEAVGADRLPGRRRGQSQHRGPADPARRDQDRRSRRGAAEGLQRLQGLLQAGRGHARHRHVGRLAEDRRCRLLRQAGPPGHHRPRQGRGQACRRLGLRAAVHREQAEVQPVHPRGGGVRRPAAVRRRHDRHRHADRRHVGREAGARLHELHGSQQQARGRAS